MNRRVQNKNSKSSRSIWEYTLFPVLLLIVIVGCSNEFKNPEKVIQSYYKAVWSSNPKFEEGYKYISSESKKQMDLSAFINSYSGSNEQRELTKIAEIDSKIPNHQLIKITFTQITDSKSVQGETMYYTLIKEGGNWEIVMLGSLEQNLREKSGSAFYHDAIKIAEQILLLDPYNMTAYGELAYIYYRINTPEKAVANIKKAYVIAPDVFVQELSNILKACPSDDCIYSGLGTFYETNEVKWLVESKDFDKAHALLDSLKSSLTEYAYNNLNKMIYDKEYPAVSTTINQLTADLGKLEFTEAWDLWMRKKIKRVKVPAYFSSSVDRMRRELTAYSSGCAEGSSMSVFYEKTNLETLFTSKDPKCSEQYMVTGELKFFSNTGSPYIQAEEIN